MGVAPWELEKRSVVWRSRALMAQGAEEWVEAERARRRGPFNQ